jgi:hypothetical protein
MLFITLFSCLASLRIQASSSIVLNTTMPLISPANNCVSFGIGPGTGCAWMCTYCANTLGTNNYYFTGIGFVHISQVLAAV